MRWGAGLEGGEQAPGDTGSDEMEVLFSPIARAGLHPGSFRAKGLVLGREQHLEEIA